VVSGERSFLHRLEGGCQIPIAAHGQVEGKDFTLTGLVADLTGEIIIKETITGPREESVSLGIALADRLLDRGAKTILDQVKEISS
jgi:hydroxymethylbilane synthase